MLSLVREEELIVIVAPEDIWGAIVSALVQVNEPKPSHSLRVEDVSLVLSHLTTLTLFRIRDSTGRTVGSGTAKEPFNLHPPPIPTATVSGDLTPGRTTDAMLPLHQSTRPQPASADRCQRRKFCLARIRSKSEWHDRQRGAIQDV